MANMIGFITDIQTADTVIDSIRHAQTSRGQNYYWTTGAMKIYSGDNAGKMFIPANDDILNTPLRKGLTPKDFPEYDQLVALLGGLEARVNINPDVLLDPDIPTETED